MDTNFIESEELKDLSTQLKEFYYLHLGHVDLEKIYFAEKVAEEMPRKANALEILGITHSAVRQLLAKSGGNQNYCITVWRERWNELHPNTRLWLLFDALYSIEPGCEGRLKRPDVVEHAPIIEYFAMSDIGVHWRKSDGELPCLLGTVPLPIPLPPDPDDETAGSTL